jgi:hypothetical protein
MRCSDIRRHLKPYSIVERRTTTVNHAFAAAIAPCDTYDEAKAREAMHLLGQDPDDLHCVYCRSKAETWDHVHATVSAKKFSGYGHRLGNLLPCCKPCNSRKGNQRWSDYIERLGLNTDELIIRRRQIQAYLDRYELRDPVPSQCVEYEQLQEIRCQVLDLFAKADVLAKELRSKAYLSADAV